jgi:hypothetical protein
LKGNNRYSWEIADTPSTEKPSTEKPSTEKPSPDFPKETNTLSNKELNKKELTEKRNSESVPREARERTPFVAPSVEEIESFCSQEQLSIDARLTFFRYGGASFANANSKHSAAARILRPHSACWIKRVCRALASVT